MPRISREKELLELVDKTLRELREIYVPGEMEAVKSHQDGYDADLIIEVEGRPVHLIIEAKEKGYPSDLRDTAWRLNHLRNNHRNMPTLPLIVSPSIPQSSRAFLRELKLGYVDMGGSLYLPLPGSLILIDRPAPRKGDRRPKNLYKGSTAQVLHVLLSEINRGWHVHEIADKAKVSTYTAHHVFTALEERELIERRGKGPSLVRYVKTPGALLDEWAENYPLKQYEARGYYYWAQSYEKLTKDVTAELRGQGVEYALTLASGAALVAPFVTGVERLSIIVPVTTDLDSISQRMDLKGAEKGANVTFLMTREKSPLMLRQRKGEVWVASNIQLYLDLWNWPARGKEQARHLREERIQF